MLVEMQVRNSMYSRQNLFVPTEIKSNINSSSIMRTLGSVLLPSFIKRLDRM